jgi:RimJ/RimL family protein N-acetyltransferase
MTADPRPTSLEETEAWLKTTLSDKNQVLLGVFHNGQLIGIIRLMFIDWVSRVSEFGIYIGPPELRGAGLGAAALEQAIEFAFTSLNLRKVWLRVLSTNYRALKLYRAYGFREEGVLQQHYFSGGIYHDLIVMAVYRQNA